MGVKKRELCRRELGNLYRTVLEKVKIERLENVF